MSSNTTSSIGTPPQRRRDPLHCPTVLLTSLRGTPLFVIPPLPHSCNSLSPGKLQCILYSHRAMRPTTPPVYFLLKCLVPLSSLPTCPLTHGRLPLSLRMPTHISRKWKGDFHTYSNPCILPTNSHYPLS